MNEHVPYIKAASDKIVKSKPLLKAAVQLRQWLMDNNMTVPQFAMQTGFNAQTLYEYICGRPGSYPSLAQAFAIEYVTKGKVPAWMWLDNPYIEARVRDHHLAAAKKFETNVKQFVLRYMVLTTNEGMIRHKARILARLFKVEWGEVKRRCWADAKVKAKTERANVDHLMYEPSDEVL